MIKDYFVFALRSIITRKLRSWLTIIGIFIGIATVVALIAIGQGMEAAITEEFEELGTNKIMVMGGGGSGAASAFGAGLASNPLTDDDLEVINDVRGVDIAGGMVSKIAGVKFGDETKVTFVSGIPTDESAEVIQDMQSFNILDGRDLEDGDGYVAIVGYNLFYKEYYEDQVYVGDNLYIEEKKFRVVGIIDRIGNDQDDTQIIIPIDTAKELFNTEELYAIMVNVDDGEEPAVIAERIKEDLRDYRDEEEGEESFGVQTFEQLLEQVGAVLNIVTAVLIGIAAISLLVGGIGIMNTMYTSVLERTREIGIMKSIGAKNSDVMLIFVLESGMYGLVGGGVGILFGAGLSLIVAYAAGVALGIDYFRADLSVWLILGALLFSFVVGVISGVLPAKQASKMQPVDALRYE